MSRKIALIGIALVVALTVTTAAFAAKGGNGGKNATSGGSGSTGHIDPSIGIASQQVGSVVFSVNTDAATGTPDLNVAVTCSDWVGATVYSSDMSVGWVASTLGYAGPFTAPSGAACVAYVHTPDSTTRLAQLSFNAS